MNINNWLKNVKNYEYIDSKKLLDKINKKLIPVNLFDEPFNEANKEYIYLVINYLKDTNVDINLNRNILLDAICYYNKKYYDNEFYNETLDKPTWLFHGSPELLKEVEKRTSHDSKGDKINIDTAVFLTSSIKIASAYAFKDGIKKISGDNKYSFSVRLKEVFPIMNMENVVTDDNLRGYIYVFVNDGSFIREPDWSLQFKSYNNLRPYKKIDVIYKDYKHLYEDSTKKDKLK